MVEIVESQAWRVSIQNLLCPELTAEHEHKISLSLSTATGSGSASTKRMQERSGKRWTKSEDELLVELVNKHGPIGWSTFSAVHFGGMRDGGALRARYYNNLLPNRQPRKAWTTSEDSYIMQRRKEVGNKWTVIAAGLEGRSGNDVKNRFTSLC
eukprot:CAMPEP_0185853322 /NCGR_PEP_ID=MMETSP1354-20130828/18519_1 /TAXON_ID=708628 /ORGANISM="Erythrolobus madagascarensis, Strain CCMP3276" /LENGTH=153 /DNA_ID=CAMNT_0028554781 /DNA_START=300 /DNA_END=758 /DNA_ORIENTATION=+